MISLLLRAVLSPVFLLSCAVLLLLSHGGTYLIQKWRIVPFRDGFTIFWILLNLLTIPLYIFLSSKLWPNMSSEGPLYGAGDPFVWFFLIAPVVVFQILANCIWLLAILWFRHKPNFWWAIIAFVIVISLWGGAVLYNRAKYQGWSSLPRNHSN